MNEAVTKLSHEITNLNYDEQKQLFNLLSIAMGKFENQQEKALNFDSYVIPSERANFAQSYVCELREDDRL